MEDVSEGGAFWTILRRGSFSTSGRDLASQAWVNTQAACLPTKPKFSVTVVGVAAVSGDGVEAFSLDS